MENIAPIQIAEPKREKRAAVTAAYRRGYADALEDMRKRQREKKRRRQYSVPRFQHSGTSRKSDGRGRTYKPWKGSG